MRSNAQNKYYWAVVLESISAHFRIVPKSSWHEAFKAEFAGGKSTGSLSTEQFEGYMFEIKVWAAERGCQVPEPNEYMKPGQGDEPPLYGNELH